MLTLFLEMARSVLFFSSFLWPLPNLKNLQKFFQWQGYQSVESTNKFLVSVHIDVGLKLFATNFVVKHIAIALTNLVCWQSVCKVLAKTQMSFHRHYMVKLALYLCASPDSSSSQNSGHSSFREDVLIHWYAPI